jgi:hypothetical protein
VGQHNDIARFDVERDARLRKGHRQSLSRSRCIAMRNSMQPSVENLVGITSA